MPKACSSKSCRSYTAWKAKVGTHRHESSPSAQRMSVRGGIRLRASGGSGSLSSGDLSHGS